TMLRRSAASRRDTAERLDVLIQQTRVIAAEHETLRSSPLVIHLGEVLPRAHFIRNVSELHRKTVGVEQSRRGRIDRDEVAGIRGEILGRDEEERLIAPDRPAECEAVLRLAEWRFLLVDRITEHVEALEVPLGVQGLVAEVL